MKRMSPAMVLVLGMVVAGASRPAPARFAPLTFDPSRIRLAQDSFAAILSQAGQSMPAGTEVVNVHKDGTKFIFEETIAAAVIGLMQSSAVSSGAAMEPLSLVGHATFQGMSMAESVTVRNGRATGSMQIPTGPAAVKTVKVDTSVAPGLLLDKDLLIALLPTAELTQGQTASLSTIDDQSGIIVPLQVTVEGTETIEVPAGRFDAVRVRAKSSDTMVIYVSTAAPRRVVRVNYLEPGIELRLLK